MSLAVDTSSSLARPPEAYVELPGALRILPAQLRAWLVSGSRRHVVPALSRVAERGSPCTSAFLVLRGALAVGVIDPEGRGFEGVTHLWPGDLCATHARVPGATHAFDLVVADGADAELLEVPGALLAGAIALDSTHGFAALTSPAVRRLVLDLARLAEPEGLLRLAASFQRRRVAEGERLLVADTSVAEWVLVEGGSVRYGEKTVGPGEDFAADAMLLDVPSPADAVARTDSTVLVATRAAVQRIVAAYPGVGRAIGRRVAVSHAQHNRWPHVVLTDIDAPSVEAAPEDAEIELPEHPAGPPWWKPLPFRRQIEHMDCGAACLRMVARYYGHELDYRALMVMAGVSRYGSNLLDLARAGEHLGFVTTGIQATWETLGQVDLPAIAHLADRHHFVVVWRITRRSVVVGDPSFSTRTMAREEFTKSWQGMLLLLKPTDRLATTAKTLAPVAGRSHTASLASLVLPYRRVLIEILLISFGLQLLGLAFPLGSQVVVDRVLLRADVKLLDVALLALVGAAVVSGVLAYARAYLILQTATRIERDVVETLYRRVMAGVSGLFQRFTTTDILNRFLEVSLIRAFFIDNAVTISIDLLMIACTGGLLLLYSPSLALVALATLPVQVVLTTLVGKLIGSHTAAYLNHHDDYQTHLMDSFKGFEMVKAHGLEIPFTRTMQRLVAPTLQHSFQATLHGSMGAATSFAIDMIGSALVLWVGARQVLAGSMTLGTLIAFTLLARQVGTPILRMASQWRDYQRTRANIDRVGSLLEVDGEGTKRSTAVVDLPVITGDVRFRGVSFRYGSHGSDRDERPTLSRIDLELAAGEIVALVGPSGCGKSTLVRLLLRLHDPTEGTVSIDGYNLRDVTPESVRSQVGLVTQDIQLVSGSIFENIACGRAVSEEAVMDAARLAGAYDFISELPYGFLTLVGERGLTLSGGQRQRIVLARALVTNPRVLIFDEATAALDPLSEQLIHERLREIVRGRTTVIISHRIQTLQHADRIIVMNEGQIVQMGTHDVLMAAGGKLYNALASATPDWKRVPEEVVDGIG